MLYAIAMGQIIIICPIAIAYSMGQIIITIVITTV